MIRMDKSIRHKWVEVLLAGGGFSQGSLVFAEVTLLKTRGIMLTSL